MYYVNSILCSNKHQLCLCKMIFLINYIPEVKKTFKYFTYKLQLIIYIADISTNVSKGLSRQRSNSQGSGTDSYDESDGCPPENTAYERENYWGRDRRQNISGFDNWHTAGSSDAYYDQKLDCTKLYDERHDFKRSQSQDKEEKPFDFESHPHEIDHRYSLISFLHRFF